MQKKILFISHDTSHTGAPILLLNFLKWLKINTNIPFLVLLRDGGELTSEFKALAPVLFFREQIRGGIVRRGLRRLGFTKFFLFWLRKKLVCENIGLIYSNTIVNGDVLEFLSFLKCPVICHAHELEYEIWTRGQKNIEQIKHYTKQYIAVSEAVKRNLIENHSIPPDKVYVIYAFIPKVSYDSKEYQQNHNLIRERLGIPTKAAIVCASGTIHWRKGPDLFIQLAYVVNKRHLDIPAYFIWLGGDTSGHLFYQLLHDIKQTGMDHYVRFIGAKPNPIDYFAICDVFVVISREEPFSLVGLEAASVSKPIVCFDNIGIAEKFISNDCGYVIPYMDIEAMAAKISDLLSSAELRQRLGERAKEKAYKQHDIEVLAPKILAMVRKFL